MTWLLEYSQRMIPEYQGRQVWIQRTLTHYRLDAKRAKNRSTWHTSSEARKVCRETSARSFLRQVRRELIAACAIKPTIIRVLESDYHLPRLRSKRTRSR